MRGAGTKVKRKPKPPARPATLYELCDAFEKNLIAQTLADHHGDLASAAHALGLSEDLLKTKCARLDICVLRSHAELPRGSF